MCIESVETVKTSVMSQSVAKESHQQDGDGLRVRRIAGGCMINHAPLFAPDGDVIYIIWNKLVRAFSVTTGEVVRDFEGTGEEIVGILFDRNNRKFLYGCTCDGQILGWNTDSGVLHSRKDILVGTRLNVDHFSVLYDENDLALFLISGHTNKRLVLTYCPTKQKVQNSTPITTEDYKTQLKFAPGGDRLNYFAFITDSLWHWATIKPMIKTVTRKHCNDVPPRVLNCHPTEDIVAIGDEIGRVILYKNFLKTKSAVPETYHWHHNPVLSVRFSHTGTHFYSGGSERVLVKWTVGKQDNREMLPRLTDSVVQIAVAPENVRVALCTADNGIQILNALQKQTAVVQSFSRISDDFTGQRPFPIGIKVNPRTQTMILNGRTGCIQFFSTYSRSLLYTLDITLRNYNTLEQKNVIFNTVVSKVAVNAHWLASAETWNDNCYSSETRLKFWKYDESAQNYVLNTNIENVHQGGELEGLEFSNSSKEREVFSATAGKDKCIKVWSVDEIEITGGGEKLVWVCIGRVDYKGLPVRSVSFSQDGSLFAGGFGNSLCVWNAETLRLKCVLSAPAGQDGGVNRAIISVPSQNSTVSKEHYAEQRSKVIKQILQVLDSKDASGLFQKVVPQKARRVLNDSTEQVESLLHLEKKYVFPRIKLQNELSLLQKAELFYRLRIQCRTTESMHEKFTEKLAKAKRVSAQAEQRLQAVIDKLCSDVKFRSKRKLHCYQQRKVLSPTLAQCTSVFTSSKNKSKKYTFLYNGNKQPPLKAVAQIHHVLFCHGEYSHLVVICTENRLLVWNLLNLRIQVTVNLTVESIVIDSFTNLIAAFTMDKELYIFLPNIPMPLYHRKNLPPVYGAAWIPRRYPKSQSLNVNWQAISHLYFLNQDQELLHLVSDSDEESQGPVIYMTDMLGKGLPNTPFAAMLAKQTSSEGKQMALQNNVTSAIGVPGKSSIKEIAASSAHAMAPISLLCKDFLKSLLILEDRRRISKTNATTGTSVTAYTGTQGHAGDDEDDDDDDGPDSDVDSELSQAAAVKAKIAIRKATQESVERAKLKKLSHTEQIDRDSKLRKLLKEENIQIEF
ncbi:WD repeat-containing protein 75 [Wyeomyia smithii]|uniref:WD repeat-containing protein 75 n=1 Tax=Wyeomyia smithii TaxID=174621 RepID=UPI002467E0D2|nr:WD repeat-containing protein 75 [Wyeomyia smithii]